MTERLRRPPTYVEILAKRMGIGTAQARRLITQMGMDDAMHASNAQIGAAWAVAEVEVLATMTVTDLASIADTTDPQASLARSVDNRVEQLLGIRPPSLLDRLTHQENDR